MIQRMKKLTFLVYHKEYDRFLVELQKLGVLQISQRLSLILCAN